MSGWKTLKIAVSNNSSWVELSSYVCASANLHNSWEDLNKQSVKSKNELQNNDNAGRWNKNRKEFNRFDRISEDEN